MKFAKKREWCANVGGVLSWVRGSNMFGVGQKFVGVGQNVFCVGQIFSGVG